MRMILGTSAILSLVVLMVVPVYADVNSVEISKEQFGIKDNFTISGTVTDANRVTLLASIKGPSGEKLTRTTISDHDAPTFSFIPVRAEELFKSRGVYTVNVFTENQRPEDGTSIRLEYSNSRIALLPDYILELKEVGNKTTNTAQNLSFTARVTDPAINSEIFSLENSPPAGAAIDPDTGRFSWTPAMNQTGSYIFDIVVNSGPLEDRETIQILVYQARETEQEPETVKAREPAIEPPEVPAPFVDTTRDPQHYIDRYNNESAYQEWFDANYPEYSSIYQAVGVDEMEEPQKEYGYCGTGTKLIDGVCTVVNVPKLKPWWQFW